MSDDLVDRFAGLAGSRPRMFWLDGGGSRAWSGRRSILGFLRDEDVSLTYDATSRTVTRHQHGRAEVVGDDPFAVLAEELARDAGDPAVSWVGYLGYACRPDLPAHAGEGCPTRCGCGCGTPCSWTTPTRVVRIERVPHVTLDRTTPPGYADAFGEVQRQLRLGNNYEVNLTYREAVTSAVDPVTAYLRLRAASPAPYAGYLQHHGTHLLSSSPERFALVDRDGWLETKPIKGTTPRGGTPDEDESLRGLARHGPEVPRREPDDRRPAPQRPLDGLRPGHRHRPDADGGRVLRVRAPAGRSTVRGRLREGVGTVEALRALFPAGSMTGAPKLRTMSIIEAVEDTARGVYAGAFGWVGADGRADLGVVIRSLVATAAGTGWRYAWAPAAGSRSAPTSPRSTPRPAGRPSGCSGRCDERRGRDAAAGRRLRVRRGGGRPARRGGG